MTDNKYWIIQTDGYAHHAVGTAAGLCFLYHTPEVEKGIRWAYSANLFVDYCPYEFIYIVKRDGFFPNYSCIHDIYVNEDNEFKPLIEAKYFDHKHYDTWGDCTLHNVQYTLLNNPDKYDMH